MAVKTNIQWCDSTCNPTMGCDGCELWSAGRKSCYAGSLHKRFGGTNPGYAPTFEEITEYPGRMAEAAAWSDLTGHVRPDKPWLGYRPRLIFVSDMSDALSSSVTFEYLLKEVINNVTSDPGHRHQWLWLTKRPGRMAQFSTWLNDHGKSWPSNLWAGTSITTQATISRITALLKVGDKNTIRFLSVEPQIETIDLSLVLPHLDWVIQGGESGRNARTFQIEWATTLRSQCREHGTPYFLKQLGSKVCSGGSRLALDDGHGGDWSKWPSKLRVRELPDITSNETK